MELRIPTLEQLRTVYDRDLKEAFPSAELKPLRNMEEMWAADRYRPWCLFDGDDIVGEAFLWLGHPGWALLDYLCVSPARRNGGRYALHVLCAELSQQCHGSSHHDGSRRARARTRRLESVFSPS